MKTHFHKKRNFTSGLALHVTLMSCHSVFLNPRVRQIVDSILLKYSKRFKVKIYHRALVGDHAHLILNAPSQECLSNFLRVVSGIISLKLRNLNILPKELPNLWRSRPWSRVLRWGRDYTIATKFVALNYLEGTKQIFRSKNAALRKKELETHGKLIEKVLKLKLTVIGLSQIVMDF